MLSSQHGPNSQRDCFPHLVESMRQGIKAVLEEVLPGTRQVFLIKRPVSVHSHIYYVEGKLIKYI